MSAILYDLASGTTMLIACHIYSLTAIQHVNYPKALTTPLLKIKEHDTIILHHNY